MRNHLGGLMSTIRSRGMPPVCTPAYWAARQRRVARLKAEIGAGTYFKDAWLVADSMLMGRTKWGEALIDGDGRRIDEVALTRVGLPYRQVM